MKIAGLVKSSLIDYPGKVSAIIFTQGCNFACPFCHNPSLINVSQKGVQGEEDVLDFLRSRIGLLDGITITGGEPTLQADLLAYTQRIKAMGFLIKIDSNGTNPRVLKRLIDDGLVDYFAMDIKTGINKYETITGPVKKENIEESISLIMNSGIDYEFRTTVVPKFHSTKDFHDIGQAIKGSKKFFVQNFRPDITLDPELKTERSFTALELEEIREILSKYVKDCQIRENI